MRGFSSAASARSSGARTSSRGAFSGDGADHDHGSQVHHLCVRSPVLPIAPGDLAMIQALRWAFASKLSTGANSLRLVGSRGVRHFALTLTGGDVSALASRTELGSRCSFCSGGFFESQLSPGPHLCPACVATSVLKHSFHSDDRNSEGPADPNGGKHPCEPEVQRTSFATPICAGCRVSDWTLRQTFFVSLQPSCGSIPLQFYLQWTFNR